MDQGIRYDVTNRNLSQRRAVDGHPLIAPFVELHKIPLVS